VTVPELEAALEAHREISRGYPRGGAGEDMFTA
jgi:hypothetical protein